MTQPSRERILKQDPEIEQMKKARPFVSFKAFHDSSPSSVICTYAGIKDKSKKTEKDKCLTTSVIPKRTPAVWNISLT